MPRRGYRFGNVPLPMLLLLGGGGLLLVVIVVIVVMMSKKESNTGHNSLSIVGCSTHQTTLNNSKLSSLKSTRTKFVSNNCPTTCAAIINGSLCQRNGQRANAKLENGNFYGM